MAGSHEEIKEPAAMLEPCMKKPYSTPELIVHGAVEKITEEQKGSGHKMEELWGIIPDRSR